MNFCLEFSCFLNRLSENQQGCRISSCNAVLSANRYSGHHTVSNNANDVLSYFLHFSFSLSKIRHRNCLQKIAELLGVLWKNTVLRGVIFFIGTFGIFCPILGTRNLNIILLSFFEFRLNRSREERVFLMNHKLTHTYNTACSVRLYDVLKTKNALVKSVYHITENIFVQSCFYFVFVCML